MGKSIKVELHESIKVEDGIKVYPYTPSGELKIAGKNITVGEDAVTSNPGSSSKNILKRLKDISKKSIFNPPAVSLNE